MLSISFVLHFKISLSLKLKMLNHRVSFPILTILRPERNNLFYFTFCSAILPFSPFRVEQHIEIWHVLVQPIWTNPPKSFFSRVKPARSPVLYVELFCPAFDIETWYAFASLRFMAVCYDDVMGGGASVAPLQCVVSPREQTKGQRLYIVALVLWKLVNPNSIISCRLKV